MTLANAIPTCNRNAILREHLHGHRTAGLRCEWPAGQSRRRGRARVARPTIDGAANHVIQIARARGAASERSMTSLVASGALPLPVAWRSRLRPERVRCDR